MRFHGNESKSIQFHIIYITNTFIYYTRMKHMMMESNTFNNNLKAATTVILMIIRKQNRIEYTIPPGTEIKKIERNLIFSFIYDTTKRERERENFN